MTETKPIVHNFEPQTMQKLVEKEIPQKSVVEIRKLDRKSDRDILFICSDYGFSSFFYVLISAATLGSFIAA
jgi:hypothetical protein